MDMTHFLVNLVLQVRVCLWSAQAVRKAVQFKLHSLLVLIIRYCSLKQAAVNYPKTRLIILYWLHLCACAIKDWCKCHSLIQYQQSNRRQTESKTQKITTKRGGKKLKLSHKKLIVRPWKNLWIHWTCYRSLIWRDMLIRKNCGSMSNITIKILRGIQLKEW